MPNEIQRYYPWRGSGMDVDPKGSYVRYSDHHRLLCEERERRISEAAENEKALEDDRDFWMDRSEVWEDRAEKAEKKLASEIESNSILQGGVKALQKKWDLALRNLESRCESEAIKANVTLDEDIDQADYQAGRRTAFNTVQRWINELLGVH